MINLKNKMKKKISIYKNLIQSNKIMKNKIIIQIKLNKKTI